jgi:ADP-ribose pyrophosphatase YjhB (NUDIX family)
VHRGVDVLTKMSEYLKRLRVIADEHAPGFESGGFTRFFAQIEDELDDAYLARLHNQLERLRFPQGQRISAHLGSGNRSIQYLARRHPSRNWLGRLAQRRSGYGFTIPARDDAGFQALGDLQNRAANQIANAVAQSGDHVLAFFQALRTELAFYVGALNLCDRLTEASGPLSTPVLADGSQRDFSANDLYDIALALTLTRCPVPNDLEAQGASLVMITGANQGGKSTVLRAIGQAQVMAQAGLVVGAESLRLNPCSGVFTHHKREEDADMESGKLDEELSRMSGIADQIKPNALLLCNEAFASTNEREGSEIARQIIRAMLDAEVKVVFVTHQYDLSSSFWLAPDIDSVFLRAEREESGERSYKLVVGEPLPTSYGADSYQAVFGHPLTTSDPDPVQPGQEESDMPMRVHVHAAIWVDDQLVLHRHTQREREHITLPGGRVRERESVIVALERDVAEEAGLDVEVGRLLVAGEVYGAGAQEVVLVFEAKAAQTGDTTQLNLLDVRGAEAEKVRPAVVDLLRAGHSAEPGRDATSGWRGLGTYTSQAKRPERPAVGT